MTFRRLGNPRADAIPYRDVWPSMDPPSHPPLRVRHAAVPLRSSAPWLRCAVCDRPIRYVGKEIGRWRHR